MRVSIIIPLYNQEKYLKQCLDSIKNQTLDSFEALIINDGSTDKSLEIAQKYQEQDPRFKIIDKENEGYGKAMNIGISLALGEYIGIVEPDDWIEPKMFEVLYAKAKEFNLDIIKSDYLEFTDGSENYIKSISEGYPREYYYQIFNPQEQATCFDFNMHTWTGLYKRQWLIDNNIVHNETPGASYQDTGFWFQTLYLAKKYMVIPEAFYHYRADAENASVSSSEKLFCVCDEYDFIAKKLNLNLQDISKNYIKIFWMKRYLIYIWNLQRLRSLKYKLYFLFRASLDFRDCSIETLGLDLKNTELLKLIVKDPIKFLFDYTIWGLEAEKAVAKLYE